MKKLALVTSYYDLVKRGSAEHRTVDWMRENAGFVLGLDRELVIFTDPELETELRKRRAGRPTKIVPLPFELLLGSIRVEAAARGVLQHNARKTKVTPAYVQLMWAKYAMLEMALAITSTSHLGWIDLGITHVAKPPPDGVDVFADPSDRVRVHVLRMFSKRDVNDPGYWLNVQGHLAGGLVVGARAHVRDLVRDFWAAVDRAVAMGLAPLDEGLLSFVVAQRPGDFSYSYGDYVDILQNHDIPRGGEAHRAWIAADARTRGLSEVMDADSRTNLMNTEALPLGSDSLPVYCLSFANSDRQRRMEKRFATVKVLPIFVEPTPTDRFKADVLASGVDVPPGFDFRVTAITLNHMKMVRQFVENSSAEYGVFCENDIHLRLTLGTDLRQMTEHCTRLALDVLLCGYLLPYREAVPRGSYVVQPYGDDLWGAQMYMLSRSHAKLLLETLTVEWALAHPNEPCSPDWTITKRGRRARVLPMLAIEEGTIVDQHDAGQVNFHRQCFEAQYDAAAYTELTAKSEDVLEARPAVTAAAEAEALLGLVMIVKNEAHGIAGTLRSFVPYIDYWTIVDTGSTDNTVEIIRETLRDIPGDLVLGEFVDFSTTRNQALDAHAVKTRWTIMPDADDRLVGGDALRTQLLAADAGADGFMVNLRRGHLDYYLPLVLRSSRKLRYIGKVHEHVDSIFDKKLGGVEIHQDAPPLSREASKKRWERDLRLLEEDLKLSSRNPRTLFYLAQTHECLGQKEEAAERYLERIAVGGWIDETFEAHLRLAGIYRSKSFDVEADHWLLKAHAFMPDRAEPLLKLAQHYHSKDNHSLAFLFANRGAAMPRSKSTLFVDHHAPVECSYIASIHAYYLKDREARQAGAEHAKDCVRVEPNDNRRRSNWAFYAPDVTRAFRATTRQIEFEPPAGWNASNPSIHYDRVDERLRCVVRTTNYKIVDGHYLTPDDNVIYTRNWMLELTNDLTTTRAVEMIDRTNIPRSRYPVHGFEDCRLYRVDDQLMCSATVCDFDLDKPSEGPREIVAMRLSDEYEITNARAIRGVWSSHPQKNWTPFELRSHEEWIYAVLNNDGKTTRVTSDRAPTSLDHGRLRGGSQLVELSDGRWLAVVHDVAFPGGRTRFYLHRFVMFDPEAKKVLAMTDPFYFKKLGIEFCCGLARIEKRLIASFSIDDASAHFAVLDLENVLNAMEEDFVI